MFTRRQGLFRDSIPLYPIDKLDFDVAHCAREDQPITVVGPLRKAQCENLLKLQETLV